MDVSAELDPARCRCVAADTPTRLNVPFQEPHASLAVEGHLDAPATDSPLEPVPPASGPRMRTEWARASDVESLWNFYLSTGFLYPEKLRALPDRGELVRQNLRSLLGMNSPDYRVALTRDTNGTITSACASANFSDSQNWVMHLASNGSSRAMYAAMEAAGQAAFTSAPWVAYTFRPNNRGVARLFSSYDGSVSEGLEDQIYEYFVLSGKEGAAVANGVSASGVVGTHEADSDDFQDLLGQLDANCNAVAALRAAGMSAAPNSIAGVGSRLRAYGLPRNRRALAVTHSGHTRAIGILDLSPFGWNFSNLGTGLQVLATSDTPEDVYLELIRAAAAWFQEHAPFGLWTALIPADRPRAIDAMRRLGVSPFKSYARIGVPASTASGVLFGYGRRLARGRAFSSRLESDAIASTGSSVSFHMQVPLA